MNAAKATMKLIEQLRKVAATEPDRYTAGWLRKAAERIAELESNLESMTNERNIFRSQLAETAVKCYDAGLAARTPVVPVSAEGLVELRRSVENTIIGLRDGWATRADADAVLAALAAYSVTNPPAEGEERWTNKL